MARTRIFLDGSAVYGLDVRLPNVVYAVIKHAPVVGSTLAATPSTPAGMIAVVPVKIWYGLGRGGELAGNTNAVAVVATNTWDAWQGARRVSPRWSVPPNASNWNTAKFFADAQSAMTQAQPYTAPTQSPLGSLYIVERSTADALDMLGRSSILGSIEPSRSPSARSVALRFLTAAMDRPWRPVRCRDLAKSAAV